MHNKRILLFSLVVPLFASCNSAFIVDKNISVVLIDNDHYEVVEHNQKKDTENNNIAHLVNGNSVNFTIKVNSNYYVSGVSYEDSRVFFIGDSQYSLTFNNVKYSTRVTVYVDQINDDSSGGDDPTDEGENEITYDTNGGNYILINGRAMNKAVYSTIHHPRPNTSIGTDIMYRYGYNLIGWNTKADLSGEHIGLGSRYLDLNNREFTLYAEWSKCNDIGDFVYHEQSDYVVIDKYTGSSSEVSIPEYINDKPVKIIGERAFFETNIEKVVLPKSITELSPLSFGRCSIKELYFFDNIVDISEGSFLESNNLSTVHINAIMEPRYVTLDRNVTYADKVDRLIINQGKKKIIILGGSGAFYNVDACVLKKLYPDYEPLNLAVNGWFNNYVQLDVINHYIEDGDVLLHVVESCGRFQFMTTNEIGAYDPKNGYAPRLFNALEQNYDLLSFTDIRNTKHFFDVFATYNKARQEIAPRRYTDYTNYADERGDYSKDPIIRNNFPGYQVVSSDDGKTVIRDCTISLEGTIDTTCYTSIGMGILCNYYQRLMDKGASIYFAFACVNKDSLLAEDKDPANIAKYESEVKGYLSKKATVINTMADILLPVEDFSNTDWHLKYEPAVEQTVILANKMGALN